MVGRATKRQHGTDEYLGRWSIHMGRHGPEYRALTMARPIRRPGNLPAEATSFIGRRRELAELRKKLTTARLVSLVGPGGVGKTRLAIRIGTDLRRGFRDGAWLVELAEVRDPALVGNATLAALDLRDQAATEPRALLLSYLRDKELLLVVDNCEHLLEAAALLVTDVLEAAPGVRVIATSREPLSVPGEHVLPDPAARAASSPGRRVPRSAPPERVGRALHRAGFGGIGQLRADRLQPGGGRGPVPPARRSAARDRARGGQDAGPLRGADPRSPGRPVRPAHRGKSRGAAASPDAANHHRMEPRPAGVGRADAPAAAVRVRRQVHARGRRVGVRVRRRAGSARPGPAVIAGRQVAGDEGGRAGSRLLSTARDDARVRRPQAAGGRRGGGRRAAMRRVLRLERVGDLRRGLGTGWSSGSHGWTWRSTTSGRSFGDAWFAADIARGMDLAASLRWFWATRATTEGVRWLDELLAIGRGDPEPQARAEYLRGFLAVLLVDPTAARPALERAAAADREAGRLRPLAASLSMASIAANMAGDRASARRLLDEAQAVAAGLDDVAGCARVPAGSIARRLLRGRPRGGHVRVLGRRASQPRGGRPLHAQGLAAATWARSP